MRPLRLEVEGFTAFRQPTVLSFDDTDLFALVGPTGAGKTSLLDAITFALYGTVPRLGDRRAVAPIVSQNLTEARVRLDFAVGGDTYTAVRVVRATRSGATTKEARLERQAASGADAEAEAPAEVLAGTADEVTAAVTSLLGLTYEHFTTCVSLPQGQFARFLHDKPRDRQDLLVKLLELGIYEQVRAAARSRADQARSRAEHIEGQLTQLAMATPEALAQAEAGVQALEDLASTLADAKPGLDGLAEKARTAQKRATELEGQVQLLGQVQAPEGIDQLAEALAASRQQQEELAAAEDAAVEAVEAAEKQVATLPQRSQLEQVRKDYARRTELEELLHRGERAAREADERLATTIQAEARAQEVRDTCAASLEQARVKHQAHALVPTLHPGEPCPVCQKPVLEIPDVSQPALDEATAALTTADRDLKAAISEVSDARTHQARVDQKLDQVRHDHAQVVNELEAAGHAGIEEVEQLLAQVAEAEAGLVQAQRHERELRSSRSQLEAQRRRLETRELAARRAFDQARDAVATLGPPAAQRQDLAQDWAGLVEWADRQRPELATSAEDQARHADEAHRQHERRWADLAEQCRNAGVDPGAPGTWPGQEVAVAQARASDQVKAIRDQMDQAQGLRQEQQAATAAVQVADALATQLAANRFEKWLLDEAVAGLAARASGILGELTAGVYGLSVDERTSGFTVIDHANAAQVRSARTLSGGETFLASLALALALADNVAELASGGAARLESLFLDEGFGTLDGDSLDVVATALDELGARGRMVGIVTHVRELAERLPVRFEVRKVGPAATVERVEA